MKELIKLLDLAEGNWLRIPILGKCFSFVRFVGDWGKFIRVKNCKTEEVFVFYDWTKVADFIRGRVINRIAINDETLYEVTLVEAILSYMNNDHPNQEMRSERLAALHKLEEEEPVVEMLMHYIDR